LELPEKPKFLRDGLTITNEAIAIVEVRIDIWPELLRVALKSHFADKTGKKC
jgi:hypothetical protein